MIKKRRESLALTQRDVAKAVGIKASYFSYLENDERTPSMDILWRLILALKSKQRNSGASCSSAPIQRRRNGCVTA
ncbi:MAG: helix-turn-helix domain-containing protein [Candidatus Binataceae bacterium]